MHPDTKIADQLTYLVPIESWSRIPFKPVKEIRLLDPACGTMHFGLVAFDVFILMYREEIERASTSGWPEKPSVESEEKIPAAIVANNLFGIDIDLRAVQLSALTLYLKAKSLNPNTKLMESKLTPASIHMLDGDRMTRFVSEIERERPILKRILVTLHERLKDSEQLGSLLRLEQEIRSLIEKERERFDREGRQFDMYRKRQKYDKTAVRQEFWESLEEEIIQALNSFVRSQKEKGFDQSFFAGEATRGLRLLETLSETFDVVVTNPPYMAQGKDERKAKGVGVNRLCRGQE